VVVFFFEALSVGDKRIIPFVEATQCSK